MVSLQALNFNLSEQLRLGLYEIPNSINFQVLTNKTSITKILITKDNQNFEVVPVFPTIKNAKKTLLLSLLNYIAETDTEFNFVKSHSDTLQNILNNLVIALSGFSVFQFLLQDDTFCKTYKNPFQYCDNFEITLLQLKYFCNLYPKFFLTPIYEILKKLKLFKPEPWNTWKFLKQTLHKLYEIYEWKNSEIFDKVRINKEAYIKFAQFLGKYIQHYYNQINRYKYQFETWEKLLITFNYETKKYKELQHIKEQIVTLHLDEKYPEAPINYPNHHQVDLYDKFSEVLDLEKKTQIENLKKTVEVGLKESISKTELKYENEKKELQSLIKSIVAYFSIIFNIDILDSEVKIKLKNLTQLLRNKLWYFHNQKGDSFKIAFKNLGGISELLKKIIEITQPLADNKGLVLEDVMSKIEVYFEEVKNKLLDLQALEYKSTLDKLLKKTITLKAFEYIEPELPSVADITINWDQCLINENQLQLVKYKISEINEYLKNHNFVVPDVVSILKEVFSIEFNFIDCQIAEPKLLQEYKEEEITEVAEPTISDLMIQIQQLKLQMSQLQERVQHLEQ